VETSVVPSMDVVKMGLLIGSTTKLDSGSSGVSIARNLGDVRHYQQQLLELLGHLKWCLLIQ
jgi:hypothetical protein